VPNPGKLLKVNMIKFTCRKYTKIVFQTQRVLVMHAKLSQIIFKKIKLNLQRFEGG